MLMIGYLYEKNEFRFYRIFTSNIFESLGQPNLY